MEFNITWLCMKKNVEQRQVLEQFLPQDLSYKVTKFNLIESGENIRECKFETTLLVNIHSPEDIEEFITEFGDLTNTTWNTFTGSYKSEQTYSTKRKCHFEVRKQINQEKGITKQDKQEGKNTKCGARMIFSLSNKIKCVLCTIFIA